MPSPSFLKQISDNWKSLGAIGVIIGGSIFGWNYAMAQSAETARKEVQIAINKEMVDGAKKAAAEAVKEQLPKIAEQVAREVAKEVVKEMEASNNQSRRRDR